jgi:glutathione S-transferase
MLELYNFSQSTCSLKVRLCLAEKQLDWVDRRLVSKDHDHLSDWYLKLNPNGVVPTLIHDGRPVYESAVIMQYLDEVFPETSLTPADVYERAQMRSWLAYVDQVTTPAVRYPSFQFGGLLKKLQAMSDEEFVDLARKRPTKAAFYTKMDKDSGFAGEALDRAFGDIRNTAARMDRMLQETGGPWLLGRQFTLADIAVAPLIDRQEDLGLEYLWEENHPGVAGWLRQIQARPACRQTYYHGCRLSEIYPELRLGRGSHRHVLDRGASAAAG